MDTIQNFCKTKNPELLDDLPDQEEHTLQIGHYRDYAKPRQQTNDQPDGPHVQQCTQS